MIHDSTGLTTALARAATRLVAETRIGARRGSIAAVARAMTERGVAISKSQLGRKLEGRYPFNTDEIEALAVVCGVSPDDLWRSALAIGQPSTTTPAWSTMADRHLAGLPEEIADEIRKVAGHVRLAARSTEEREAQ